MKRIRACRLREAGAAAAAFSFAGNCEVYPDGAVCSSPRMSTLRDHRRHQAARARRLRIDQLVEAEPCHRRPHGVDMAVKLRLGAFEIATERPKLFTLVHPSHRLDLLDRQTPTNWSASPMLRAFLCAHFCAAGRLGVRRGSGWLRCACLHKPVISASSCRALGDIDYGPPAIRTISRAMSSGERTKSIHPLAIALAGMSGWLAVSGFCAMVMPPTSLMPHKASAPSPS